MAPFPKTIAKCFAAVTGALCKNTLICTSCPEICYNIRKARIARASGATEPNRDSLKLREAESRLAGFFVLKLNEKNRKYMRTYETVTIVKPQLSDTEVAAFVTTVKELVAKNGGEVTSEEKLGRRKFTHEINHVRDGFYLYLKFKAQPEFVKVWEETMKLDEKVLRSMVMLANEIKAKPASVAK